MSCHCSIRFHISDDKWFHQVVYYFLAHMRLIYIYILPQSKMKMLFYLFLFGMSSSDTVDDESASSKVGLY